MKKTGLLKKVICVLLSLTVAFGALMQVLAFQDDVSCPIPVIVISGDSDTIYDKDNNVAYSTKELGNIVKSQIGDENGKIDYSIIIKEIAHILVSYYIHGCLFFDFDEYYQRIYDAVYPLVGEAHLDKNGENTNGSHIAYSRTEEMNRYLNSKPSSYDTNTYRFRYDWRLDPFEIADQLNDYIEKVKAVNGVDKVGVICRCLGGNCFMAYVAKYGVDSIQGVGFDGVTTFGCEILGDTVSGKFVFDVPAINRLLLDLKATGHLNLDNKIIYALDTVNNIGLVSVLKAMIKFPYYNKMIKGITSSLSLGTFFTWPNYWAAIGSDNYETAKEYIFGPEGSEKRQEYAGLIEKIDNYDVQVRQRIPELLTLIRENCNVCLISKYGTQCSAITTSNNKVGDQFISVEKSSLGATCALIGEQLSEDYIAKVISEGNGKYISPDKQIDGSTALFPECTFYIKGASHSDWTYAEMELMVKVISADHQLTVDDLPDNQFMIYDYGERRWHPMTTENCNTEAWTTDRKQFTKNIKAAVDADKNSKK